LATSDGEYRTLAERRREMRKKIEDGRDRRTEISGLLERFKLLDEHYVSDVARLRGLEEGGTLFQVMGQTPCPLCGAEPAHHRTNSDCDGNIEAVVAAAQSEIAKIELLRTELADTITNLDREATGFDRRLPKLDEDLHSLSREIEQLVNPKLTQLRANYAALTDKRGEIKSALAIYQTIKDIEARQVEINNNSEGPKQANVSEGDLPVSVAEAFAQQVEAILKEWHFPDADRVFFDAKSRDLVIAGKARTARGKGLRAITHAAFTIGLLQFCKAKDTPHPSFVILDTPLRAYREPEGAEDDLTGTDLNVKFYDYLARLQDDRQVIIIENTDPPAEIAVRQQVVMFSKNPHSGRYGFFPIEPEDKNSVVPSGDET
jgi:hypothetical protein